MPASRRLNATVPLLSIPIGSSLWIQVATMRRAAQLDTYYVVAAEPHTFSIPVSCSSCSLRAPASLYVSSLYVRARYLCTGYMHLLYWALEIPRREKRGQQVFRPRFCTCQRGLSTVRHADRMQTKTDIYVIRICITISISTNHIRSSLHGLMRQ
ncbi:hypothetical protein F4678DRAFT_81509 [Xylaria arbuscula]|nr:hypothetical protein F4678DRAFT_81509 [Xylaria arbuscula]